MTEILFGKTSPTSVPIFAQADRAKEIVKICISVCDTLCRGEKVKLLVAKLRIMRKAINYLEETLYLPIQTAPPWTRAQLVMCLIRLFEKQACSPSVYTT